MLVSSGIGEALALKYARPGVFLALVGRKKGLAVSDCFSSACLISLVFNTPDLMETVADACRQLGAEVEIGLVDVTDAKGLEAFMLKVDATHPLDLVVANAGVSGSVLGDIPFEEKLVKVYDINVYGVFHTINPILAKFQERKAGQIAVVGSLSGFFDVPRSTAYGSSKAAVQAFCRGLRGLMKPYGVGVTIVCPGFVQTNFTKFTLAQGRSTPFIISSERAATIIKSGLESNPPIIGT